MEENKINTDTNGSNNTTTTTENKLTLDDVLKGYRDDNAEKTIKRNEARDKYARIVNGAKAIGSIIGGSAYFSPSNTIQQAQQDNQNEIRNVVQQNTNVISTLIEHFHKEGDDN